MSDPKTYRIDYTRDASDGAWVGAHTESLVNLGVLVPDDTLQAIADGVAGYAFVQGGLSGAMYQCDKDEAEYALIPVALLDALEGTDNESAETPTTCEFRDLTCPCNDGDQCHYTGTNPMPSNILRREVYFVPLDDGSEAHANLIHAMERWEQWDALGGTDE